MRIDNMIQSLTVLAKADAMIAEATFKARLSDVALGAVALCLSVFGLIMLGIAVFFALQDAWGPIWAAAAVGLGSFVVAGLLVAAAAFRRPARGLEMAHEMHTMALNSLIEEARLAGNDFGSVRGLIRSATEGTLLGTIAPLVTLLLRLLRRYRDKDAAHP